jgi:hypothetical protein
LKTVLIYHYGIPSKTLLPVGTWVTPKGGLFFDQAIAITYLSSPPTLSQYSFEVPPAIVNWLPGKVSGYFQGQLATAVTTFVETPVPGRP